jgi:hypothetical protein
MTFQKKKEDFQMIKYVIIAAVLSSGCTDAYFGKLKSLGSSASVKCYSGGKLVVDTMSTGKIRSEANSNGYYFVEKDTGEMIEVDADCIFRYIK